LGQQDHAFLGSALHFIQNILVISPKTFTNILKVPKWVQFAGCSLHLVI